MKNNNFINSILKDNFTLFKEKEITKLFDKKNNEIDIMNLILAEMHKINDLHQNNLETIPNKLFPKNKTKQTSLMLFMQKETQYLSNLIFDLEKLKITFTLNKIYLWYNKLIKNEDYFEIIKIYFLSENKISFPEAIKEYIKNKPDKKYLDNNYFFIKSLQKYCRENKKNIEKFILLYKSAKLLDEMKDLIKRK